MQKDAQIQASTYARHIAAKVAADLKRLQVMSGSEIPSDKEIADYQEEMSLLLHEGYLGEMIYGFAHEGIWIVALKYSATGKRLADPGDGLGLTTENTGMEPFASCLAYSSDWQQLPHAERKEFEKNIPFDRITGMVTAFPDGDWQDGGGYASGDLSVRCMIAAKRASA